MVIVNRVIILSVYYFLTVMVQQLLNVTSLVTAYKVNKYSYIN